MSEIIRFHQSSLFSGLTGTIDHENCVVHGVSLITSGITATGHDLFVDDTSVNTFHKMGSKMEQLPVNLDHGSGIISMNGYIDNFRKDQGKWRGDWHLLKSHAETPVMLERCERQSKTFGFSLAFSGDKAGVLRNGKKCAHPEALLSADCVVRPAANKSLFGVKDGISVDTRNFSESQKRLQKNHTLTFMADQSQQNEPTLADALARIDQLTQLVQQQAEMQQQIIGHINGQTENQGEEGLSREQLEELFHASDEQLAQLGITRDEVNAAVDQFNASLGQEGEQNQEGAEGTEGAEGESAGAGAMAGAETGAPGGTTALKAIQRELIQLKAKFNAKEKAEIQFAEAQEAGKIEQKFIALAEQNKKLVEFAEKVAAENECLRIHLSTGTRPVEAGTDSGMRLFSANGSGELHPYQQKLKSIIAAKNCSEGKAIEFADKEDNGALHAEWLQSLSASRTIHA